MWQKAWASNIPSYVFLKFFVRLIKTCVVKYFWLNPNCPAGFKLTNYDLGNAIHFSFLTMQFFPPSQEITISKYIIKFLFPTIKNEFNMHVSCFIWIVCLAAECILNCKKYIATISRNYKSGKTFMSLISRLVFQEPKITYYSLDPIVLTKQLSLFWLSVSCLRTIFIPKWWSFVRPFLNTLT